MLAVAFISWWLLVILPAIVLFDTSTFVPN